MQDTWRSLTLRTRACCRRRAQGVAATHICRGSPGVGGLGGTGPRRKWSPLLLHPVLRMRSSTFCDLTAICFSAMRQVCVVLSLGLDASGLCGRVTVLSFEVAGIATPEPSPPQGTAWATGAGWRWSYFSTTGGCTLVQQQLDCRLGRGISGEFQVGFRGIAAGFLVAGSHLEAPGFWHGAVLGSACSCRDSKARGHT